MMPKPADSGGVDPLRLTIAEAARLLSRVAARRIEEDAIRADITCGAPTNDDGTINLVQFTAWLVKEAAVAD